VCDDLCSQGSTAVSCCWREITVSWRYMSRQSDSVHRLLVDEDRAALSTRANEATALDPGLCH